MTRTHTHSSDRTVALSVTICFLTSVGDFKIMPRSGVPIGGLVNIRLQCCVCNYYEASQPATSLQPVRASRCWPGLHLPACIQGIPLGESPETLHSPPWQWSIQLAFLFTEWIQSPDTHILCHTRALLDCNSAIVMAFHYSVRSSPLCF